MISNVNNINVSASYARDSKNTLTKENANAIGRLKDTDSRVDKLKESVDSGEYKVNLSALANKMADELL